jgi:hypothetical protein
MDAGALDFWPKLTDLARPASSVGRFVFNAVLESCGVENPAPHNSD